MDGSSGVSGSLLLCAFSRGSVGCGGFTNPARQPA
jgi:hypothetical protein